MGLPKILTLVAPIPSVYCTLVMLPLVDANFELFGRLIDNIKSSP